MITETFYSQWQTVRRVQCVEESGSGPPPERVLQALWQRQYLDRQALCTLEGRPVTVLHPGFWNHEAGPDFQSAVIRFGEEPPISGPVEIDLRSADWRAHGHASNPAFAGVILHVVWEGPAKTPLPTLALQPHLAAGWEKVTPIQTLPTEFAGRCHAPLGSMPEADKNELLKQAATARLQAKANSLVQMARANGWEAALMQGLFRALGYKHNVWPMQYLAEQWATLQALPPTNAMGWQARLLGMAGWLTDDECHYTVAARKHLQWLWHHWWRERDALEQCMLPRSVWRLGGLRPANHPIRRLVLLAHWLAAGDLVSRLESWMQMECPSPLMVASLGKQLIVPSTDFWDWHWTFRSPRQERVCPLLGEARVTDLAVNVILPWFYARAQIGRNRPVLSRVKSRYHQWPAAQDNAVLKLARERLFGGAWRMKGAAQQQGVLQIVRDFCDHAPATCEDCSFPDLVQSWPRERGDIPDS